MCFPGGHVYVQSALVSNETCIESVTGTRHPICGTREELSARESRGWPLLREEMRCAIIEMDLVFFFDSVVIWVLTDVGKKLGVPLCVCGVLCCSVSNEKVCGFVEVEFILIFF